MCGAGGDEAGPSFAPQLLTDTLVGSSCASGRLGGLERDASQLLDVAEVGELEVKAPAMVVVGNVILGRESPLGKRAIPLRCGCSHGVGEIESAYALASLPSPIRRRIGLSEQISSARGRA